MKPQLLQTTVDLRTTIHDLIAALAAANVERETECRLLVASAVARQNLLLLCEPGVGKSRLAQHFADAIAGDFFSVLLGKASEPAEVLGSPNLKTLAETGKRIVAGDNMLPSAHVAFLDEIFKSNSVTLNALLTALNERRVRDDNGWREIPLRLAVAASNEVPEDDSVAALYDRFLVRLLVTPIAGEQNFDDVVTGSLPAPPGQMLSVDDIDAAHAEAMALPVDKVTLEAIRAIRAELRNKGVVVSDRRWAQSIALMRALAWIDGHSSVGAGAVDVLRHCTWSSPDQRPTVDEIIEGHLPKLDAAVQKIAKVLAEQDEAIRSAAALPTRSATQERLGAVGDVLDDLESDIAKLEQEWPGAPALGAIRARLQTTRSTVETASIVAFRRKA